MPSKVSVRHVKGSSEEMACDPSPREMAGWVPVGRGSDSRFVKPVEGATMVQLDADVAKVFTDSATVNNALRKLIEAVPASQVKKRKTA